MSNYVKEWYFTENGECFDLTKIIAITFYMELRLRDEPPKYVILLKNKSEILVTKEVANGLRNALQKREVAIEEHITSRLKEMMEACE